MRPHLACFLLILSCSSLVLADDSDPSIDGWGQVTDPDGDCAVAIDGDSLSIQFGAGPHGLDAENNRMNSPRILQTVQDDFSIQVTVDGELPLPELDGIKTRAYISGGIVLIQDDKNYIRFERASFTRNGTIWHYANFEQRIDAKRTRMGLFADFPLQNDQPVDMRLEVRGNHVRALVRHTGEAWHELGKARMQARDALMVGVSGVKTSAEPAKVSFRNLKVDNDLVAAEAKSESDIDLNEIRRIIRVPGPQNIQWKDLIEQVEDVQQRGKRIAELSADEHSKLIEDAKRLGTQKTPKLKAYLGPSIARRLADNFQEAGMPEHSIRVYREFADALEGLRESGLESTIRSLRESADQLQANLPQN